MDSFIFRTDLAAVSAGHDPMAVIAVRDMYGDATVEAPNLLGMQVDPVIPNAGDTFEDPLLGFEDPLLG